MNKPHLSNTDPVDSTVWVSQLTVPKMDCPSEEQLIRMALDGVEEVQGLSFDLQQRQVQIFHQGTADALLDRLVPLGLGARLDSSEPAAPEAVAVRQADLAVSAADEAKTLKLLIGINGLMFVIELAVGLWAQSAGLIADSLDMFADAAVYGLALYAVGRAATTKLRAAHFAGWTQIILVSGVFVEVVRRFVYGSDPQSLLMIGMGCLALVANVVCLLLIFRNRDNGVHMKASWIFSANDVIANSGVVLAGVLVYWTGSQYPDLIIGLIIGVVVLGGALKILRLKI